MQSIFLYDQLVPGKGDGRRGGSERRDGARAKLKRGGSGTCSFLASNIQDIINNISLAIFLFLAKDNSRNLNQVAVEISLVPFLEYLQPTNQSKEARGGCEREVMDTYSFELVVRQAKNGLEEVVCLADELDVSVLDSVVNHLNVMTSSSLTNPVTAWSAIFNLSSNCLQDWFDSVPSLHHGEKEKQIWYAIKRVVEGREGDKKMNEIKRYLVRASWHD